MRDLFMDNAVAICNGQAVELRSVHDSVFSQRLAGDGYAIRPNNNQFVSPIDGKIRLLFRGLHALVIEGHDGIDFLIHIGINTVQLNGVGFMAHVSELQEVKKGDLLISVDESHLNNPRIDLTSLVLVMKPKAVKNLSIKTKGYCEAGQTIMLEYDVKDTL